QIGQVHHAGNFRARALTNAMDHVRLSLVHIGKLMFVQFMEIDIPARNRGLFPGAWFWCSCGRWDSLLQLRELGVDIAASSYMDKSNALGGMNVGMGNVSAEMRNQSVKSFLFSLALIAARYTLAALEVAALLVASHLIVICQALDLCALSKELRRLIRSSLTDTFPSAH
ncbi:phenylalanine ammonia-lyase, partial [Suillus occidentalis]